MANSAEFSPIHSIQIKNVQDTTKGKLLILAGEFNGRAVNISLLSKDLKDLQPGHLEKILGDAFVSDISVRKDGETTAILKSKTVKNLKITMRFFDDQTASASQELQALKSNKLSLNYLYNKENFTSNKAASFLKKTIGKVYSKAQNAIRDLKEEIKKKSREDKESTGKVIKLKNEDYVLTLPVEEPTPEGEELLFGAERIDIAEPEKTSAQQRKIEWQDQQLKVLSAYFKTSNQSKYANSSLDIDNEKNYIIVDGKKPDSVEKMAIHVMNFLNEKTRDESLEYTDRLNQGLETNQIRQRLESNRAVLNFLANNKNHPIAVYIQNDEFLSHKLYVAQQRALTRV